MNNKIETYDVWTVIWFDKKFLIAIDTMRRGRSNYDEINHKFVDNNE